MIRRATLEDLPRLNAWAEQFLAYHPFLAMFPREPEAVEAMLRKMIAGVDAVLLVHDHGAIGGVATPLWTNPSIKVASELFWWAEKDGLSLMRAFGAWAKDQGAEVVHMVALLGVEQDVTRIYDRAGFLPIEITFVKEIAAKRAA